MNSGVKATDMTWEQKEQVLRELFTRMNASKASATEEP